jgi:hypothetical protein
MDRTPYERQQVLEEVLLNAEEEEEEQAVLYQFVNNTRLLLSRPSIISPQVIHHVGNIASQTMQLADSFARRYMPDLKQDMNTSSLTGEAWIHECLINPNKDKMPETFGMSRDTFMLLLDELGLEDARSVTRELQLADFLLAVRRNSSVRQTQDRVQRAKDTVSGYFKLVLERLADRDGFYGRYVRMPTDETPTPTYISANPLFANYFQDCIGAIDGTHLPIL